MKDYIKDVPTVITFTAIKAIDASEITTGTVTCTIRRQSDNEYWNGTIWVSGATNLNMTHDNNGIWTFDWTPDIVGDILVTCRESTGAAVPDGRLISVELAGRGTGTNTVTITLTESGGTPKIPSALVVIKDTGDTTVLAQGTTDANGDIIFMISDGTYNVHKTKLGSYSFINPETLTVSGNTAQSYIGTPISVSAPATPNTSRLFIWVRNPDSTLVVAGLIGHAQITTLPFKASGSAFEDDRPAFVVHADGYWYVDVVYGATIEIYIPTLNLRLSTTVLAQTTFDIETLID
jgi:hypothetical protein